jgi:CxxC motif-containing protein (DUF1111 family)
MRPAGGRGALAAGAILTLVAALLGTSLAAGLALAPVGAASGGETTRFETNRNAFTLAAANLPRELQRGFFFGNRLFNTSWATAPASVKAFDGLGPLLNRVSCSGCHLRDGRGRPPVAGEEELLSMLVRLSVPGTDAHGGPRPDPVYGDQLNDRAILGVPAEGRPTVEWEERPGSYGDGTAFSLREPHWRIDDLAYGPLGAGVMLSPRVAPAVIGLGLLEAVPEATIQALADPDDADGDGISGRMNTVWDAVAKRPALGRFGWKANQPTVMQQNAAAAQGDIGLTTSLFPAQSCSPAQTACGAAITGGDPELSDAFLEKLTLYTRVLAVPGRRDLDDPSVRQGEALFTSIGCAACHTPTLVTGDGADEPGNRRQTIHPFTDLLLHDMGPGLADGRPDFLASGREWRTPPLWGIGLVRVTNDHEFFLHDGRARGFAEAILWHGGEAERAREAFRTLPPGDRDELLAFLRSL